MNSKEVLDTPEELAAVLRRDIMHLNALEQNTDNVFAQERMALKRQAIEDGVMVLTRATLDNPEDADAAYRAVLEKFAVWEFNADKPKTGRGIMDARIQGKKEGLRHVLNRVRTARG